MTAGRPVSSTAPCSLEIPAREIFVLAASAGLFTGVIEGLGLLLLQTLGWLNWERLQFHVTLEIVAISAAFDFILFSLGGLAWALASVVVRRLKDARFVLVVLASLAFFDWLSLPGYLHDIGTLFLAVGMAVAAVRTQAMRLPATLSVVRRSVPWVFAGGMMAITAIPTGLWAAETIRLATLPPASPGAPNVVFVVMDTLRADEVSAYGYHRETTPNLDRLSREGVLFEQAFSASSWSPPAHASLLTGRYPYEHQVEWNHPLDGRFPTFSEVLLSQGYATAAFSGNKWWFNRGHGFGRGFIHFEALYHSRRDSISRTLYGRMLYKYLFPYSLQLWPMTAEQVTRQALKWLDAHRGPPFLLFVNFIDCHDPYVSPAQFRTKFTPKGKPEPCDPERDAVGRIEVTPELVRACTDAYDGAVAYADYSLGQLLAGLKQRGLLNNALVVVTSDHGELLFEHGLFAHRNSLYLPEIRVPLVISWPSRIHQARVRVPISTASLPRTILDLLGNPRQGEFPGPSLRQLWESPTARDWPWPLAQLEHSPFVKHDSIPAKHGAMKSLVAPRWHYIVHETFGEELYDWQNDPHEERNLISTPEGKAVALDFRRRLEQMLAGGRNVGAPR